ncbi:MAG: hypothetical protein RRC34_07915 [Lentisphaeria bacterium]|nr:hypothetical protein [Lentisphaeria bacterium]
MNMATKTGVVMSGLALVAGLLCGCMSGISYSESEMSTPLGGEIGDQTGARKVMVMPVGIEVADTLADDDAARQLSGDPVFLEAVLRHIGENVDRNPALFTRVPMPVGQEADALMRTAVTTAGQLSSPEAFAGTVGFALPEFFVYGSVRLDVLIIPRLVGEDDRFYVAETMLRLVDRDRLTFVPFAAKVQDRDAETAIRAAIAKAAAAMVGR